MTYSEKPPPVGCPASHMGAGLKFNCYNNVLDKAMKDGPSAWALVPLQKTWNKLSLAILS